MNQFKLTIATFGIILATVTPPSQAACSGPIDCAARADSLINKVQRVFAVTGKEVCYKEAVAVFNILPEVDNKSPQLIALEKCALTIKGTSKKDQRRREFFSH